MPSLEYPSLRGPKRLGDRLLEAGLITRTQLDAALARQEAGNRPRQRLGRTLVDLGFLSDRDLTQILSVHLASPVAPFSIDDPDAQAIASITATVAHRHHALPCRVVGSSLLVAVGDKVAPTAIEELQRTSGRRVLLYLAPATEVEAGVRAHYGRVGPDELRELARRLQKLADDSERGHDRLATELARVRADLDAVLMSLTDPPA